MKINFTFLIALIAIALGYITTPCEILPKAFASPINPSMQIHEKGVEQTNKDSECKAFITITNKAAGAANTMDLAVILRYINELKQDLLVLKVEDSQLKSLQERYLQFSGDMGEQLTKAKRDQAQGDYAAFQAASANLTATGSRGIDLEQELQQYCGKS
ncbi:hypothetical protein [Pseudanabaena sp. ABRG5-3]|uniref:hypothetical protein n=1 Tax=Pseudanabaena sp. ABRG5-3 TaxID=685565 RepID=UPI000DC6F946|nr:hypothetical protein [Pseudanabaena sp. ABRG5-3]BBC26500.1 hypothetical protein ABRG53_4243 [Pseudanabaena sp. ABRG5-3]